MKQDTKKILPRQDSKHLMKAAKSLFRKKMNKLKKIRVVVLIRIVDCQEFKFHVLSRLRLKDLN